MDTKEEHFVNQSRWLYHPIFIFIFSLIALVISLFLYIYWYISISAGLKTLSLRYNLDPNQFLEAKTWVVILVLSLLVGVILAGILTIFIYNLKTLHLYRLQHTFISNFTHELKTPVTSLKLYLETFDKHEIPREDQLKYISFMLQDVGRLSGTINSILNLARIESKVYEGEFTTVDLVDLVQEFLDTNHHIFRNCEIHVENPSGEACSHPVIIPLFEMLLMNLLTNAVKYNDSGKPRVDISFKQGEGVILICIRDNGIGIEPGERKKIFKKFYRGHRDNKHVSVGGSGIGLYLAQHIARLHHGNITATSEGIGKGSIFTLYLHRRTQKKDQP
jgi:signal transduction histidine kinase